MLNRVLRRKKEHCRPRTLCDVSPQELRQAVEKMCRELRISPSLPGCYDLYQACARERENQIDKRFWMLEG